MRSRCSYLLLVAVMTLASAPAAAAHVTPSPQFMAAGDRTTLTLTGPNERDEPMTGFRVTLPADFLVLDAPRNGAWVPDVKGRTVSWRGGSLAPRLEESFRLVVDVPTAPGPATLEVAQRYPGDEVVSWSVSMTITPEAPSRSQNLRWGLFTALVGILVLAGLAVALFRRTTSLQER